MRLAVYVDDVYRVTRENGRVVVTADRAFLLFAAEVGRHFDELVVVGRAISDGSRADYELPEHVRLVPLPYYATLRDFRAVIRAAAGTARAFWRAGGRADVVWAFGPHPLQLVFVVLALARGRRVVLGVRQDTAAYFRARAGSDLYPALPGVRALDAVHVALARRLPTTVVGRAIAARYRHARRLLPMTVTLVRARDRAEDARSVQRGDPIRLLTVGRLDREKNPLLLVDALRLLEQGEPGRFRLTWVGRGPLEQAVRRRASSLGVSDLLDLRGYVPHGDELMSLYRDADVFVHVSLTEGVPQVLVEAFSTGTPVVATDVGGVRDAVAGGEAAVLVPPGDAALLADAIRGLADEPETARSLSRRGLELTAGLTLEEEAARVAAFVRDGSCVSGPLRRKTASVSAAARSSPASFSSRSS